MVKHELRIKSMCLFLFRGINKRRKRYKYKYSSNKVIFKGELIYWCIVINKIIYKIPE